MELRMTYGATKNPGYAISDQSSDGIADHIIDLAKPGPRDKLYRLYQEGQEDGDQPGPLSFPGVKQCTKRNKEPEII